jgi:hypothetical protein
VQLSTPIARQSVMEGRTLAIAAFNTKLDDEFEIATKDPKERAEIEKGMRDTEARIEGDMDPYKSASQMDTDEIVALGELRGWLETFAQCAYQATGYRTQKNPRIWSLHDLRRLVGAARMKHTPLELLVVHDGGTTVSSRRRKSATSRTRSRAARSSRPARARVCSSRWAGASSSSCPRARWAWSRTIRPDLVRKPGRLPRRPVPPWRRLPGREERDARARRRGGRARTELVMRAPQSGPLLPSSRAG